MSTQSETFIMPLPDHLEFADSNSAVETIIQFGRQQGVAITIERSRKKRGIVSSIDFKCDRGGAYRQRRTGPAVRQGTGTRLAGCPFKWKLSKPQGTWVLRAECNVHNHQPDVDMSGHPSARRLTSTEQERIAEMTVGGSTPRAIVSALHQANPDSLLIARTVYNERSRIRQVQLDGRTPIRALVDELSQTDQYVFDFRTDNEDRVTHLFFAHKISVNLLRRYGSVLLMDCTYKTNKFKMPLLQVVGITSFWSTFFGCFVFLAGERQDDYDWALRMIREKIYDGRPDPITIATDREQALMNAIPGVFPTTNNVLCMWHIEKNLVANCKGQFDGDDEAWDEFLGAWRSVVRSLEVEELERGWEEFKATYRSSYSVAIAYIESTWMVHKERFGTPWTRRYLHLGSTTTSRVESAHHTLKSYIRVSTSHLHDVQQRIGLAVANQEKEYKAKMMNDRIRVAHAHRILLFCRIVGKISDYALKQTLKQVSKANEANLGPCTNSYTTTMGLPCAHFIANISLDNPNATLSVDHFHHQWWIDDSADIPVSQDEGVHDEERGDADIQPLVDRFLARYQQAPLHQQLQARRRLEELASGPAPSLLDPSVRRGRGRPNGSASRHDTSSTRRDPSAFEIAERTPRLCSRCRLPGHNIRSCPN